MKVILINGSGGSGKDTIVKILKSKLKDKYNIYNISTIDKVKEIAREMGWDDKKDERGRQFLADLKDLWTKYNNGANEEVLKRVVRLSSDEELETLGETLVFIHCREPLAIQWFVDRLRDRDITTHTMLVTREGIQEFFNEADKGVLNYKYETIFYNDFEYEELLAQCDEFADLLRRWKTGQSFTSLIY
jgi:SpoVK/Ycf46/Vps4 family AAA+-type ATPase